jgi:Cu2+-exporting ATPase
MESEELSTEHAHNREVKACIHCDAPLIGKESFCCVGCEAAYNVLQGDDSATADIIYSPFAKELGDGQFELMLSVKGVHCSSCIQLIENALHNKQNVLAARVNMSTERLSISWQGSRGYGDALAYIVNKLGYSVTPFDDTKNSDKEHNAEKALLLRIAVAGFAAGNLMMISVGLWSSSAETMGMATRDFFHWASAIIAIPTVFYTGRPFFSSALAVLKQKHTNMDVPISIAVILACAMSVLETYSHGEHVYFDSAVMLIFFLLIGRYLDARAKGKAKESAQELLSLLGGMASVMDGKKISSIPIRDLRAGMLVSVAVGENIAADGVVLNGASDLDMSMITGESLPQQVVEGSDVFAGTVNISSPIQITVGKASDDSLLSDIVKLMEKAEQGQAHYVRLADKAARLYTPIVHFLGLISFVGWWLVIGEPWQPSLLIAITVLIITCPCALGLAVPVVQVLASGRLMKKGILLKSGDALEKLERIDTIILDKTGTLTMGKPELVSSHDADDLQLAVSLASHSRHPLSKAICGAFEGKLLDVFGVEEVASKGLLATFKGEAVKLGNATWCGEAKNQSNQLELWLVYGDRPAVCFTFTDTLRDDAKAVVKHFIQAGIKPIILSGDHQSAVEKVAKEVGVEEYKAAFSPIEKCDYIEALQAKGHRVLMVGDGLNDAPSLAMADVSISPSSAIDIAQNTADVVFQGARLGAIIEAWQVAQKSTVLVKQNFALAIIYNIIAVPLAVMGYVTPMAAAAAMSGSSLAVIANSFRLHQKKGR